MIDPNPKVSGKGLNELRRAGIEVVTGIGEDAAKKLNEAYCKFITTRKPFVILKTAMTLDGKIATPEGQSKWITGDASRKVVHRLRSSVDAIMTAIGTVNADDSQMTARIRKGKNPIRILIDPNLDIHPKARILQTPPETIIVTKSTSSKKHYLKKAGIQIITFRKKLDLNHLLKKLGTMDIGSVLIEGGSSLNAHALKDRIVDKVMFFIAPKIIGGTQSYPSVGGKSFQKLEDAYMLKTTKIRKIKDDFLIEGYIKKNND
jgi:diaminohydroxyphosphoribosylaminopyrimidine deaminase/5-amino-6-(5-phosphoribosylamino)uracil reductase